MTGVEVNEKGQIVALPFRVEKLRYRRSSLFGPLLSQAFSRPLTHSIKCSFDAKWASDRVSQLDLDLTCCTFSKTPC